MGRGEGSSRALAQIRFKAYALSLISIVLLVVSLLTSWAYVRAVDASNGIIQDIWNLKFFGLLLNGFEFPFPGILPYLAAGAGLLLLALLLQVIIAVTLVRGEQIRTSLERMPLLSVISAILSTVLLIFLSIVVTDRMAFPMMFGDASVGTVILHTEPGIAWFLLLFATVLMLIEAVLLRVLVKRLDLEVGVEEIAEDDTACEDGIVAESISEEK